MSFFDKLSANITNASRTMSQSVKNHSDTSQLQKEMNSEKRNIQQKYAEIGQLYYEQYKNDPGAAFAEQIASISASEKRIGEIQNEIQDVQNRKPELVPVPQDPPREPAARPSAMVCMQCGKTYPTTQVFCIDCGQKRTPQYPPAAAAAAAPAQTAADVQQKPVPAPEAPAAPADNDAAAAPAAPPETAPEAPAASDTPAENKARFCSNCGAEAAPDSAFCTQCGNKL